MVNLLSKHHMALSHLKHATTFPLAPDFLLNWLENHVLLQMCCYNPSRSQDNGKHLQDAIHFLRHTNSAVTKTPGQFIPLPGPQLTASLLFFISAITSGDIRKMVGKETSTVLKKNNDLFKRLQEDAKQLQRLAAKNPVKEA